MIEVLEVGAKPAELSAAKPDDIFKDTNIEYHVTTLDADPKFNPDIVWDIQEPFPSDMHEKYDIVFASHVMEHVDRGKALDTFRNLVKALKVGGELYVLVPSFEWACTEVYFHRLSLPVQAVIYGGQQDEMDYHKCGYTLEWLRWIVENVLGMAVRRAYTSMFQMSIEQPDGEVEVATAGQNIIIALKVQQNELNKNDLSSPGVDSDVSDGSDTSVADH